MLKIKTDGFLVPEKPNGTELRFAQVGFMYGSNYGQMWHDWAYLYQYEYSDNKIILIVAAPTSLKGWRLMTEDEEAMLVLTGEMGRFV